MSRFTYNLSPNYSGKFHFTRQGISLPLDRQSYSRRLLGLKFEAKTSPLNLAAPGRCQSLYIFLRIRRDLCFYETVATPDSVPTKKEISFLVTPSPEVTESFCRVPLP